MLSIKILGPGCANCKRLDAVAREVLGAAGVAAEIEKVTDYAKIVKWDILARRPGHQR
jgi:hypothetical protein